MHFKEDVFFQRRRVAVWLGTSYQLSSPGGGGGVVDFWGITWFFRGMDGVLAFSAGPSSVPWLCYE